MALFTWTNQDGQAPTSQLPTDFEVSAPPNTDIWRKPPSTEAFNAPILHRTIPSLAAFRKARVSISADWKTLYDQGGLIIVAPQQDGTKKWVKTGIEFYGDQVNVSTVAADRWADWSLIPVSATQKWVTIEIAQEQKGDAYGPALWVYIIEGVQRKPVREVSWFFEDADKVKEAWIGVYAAKPTPEQDESRKNESLTVNFSHLTIETAG